MSQYSNDGNRLIHLGLKRIFLHGLLFGVPCVITLVVAGLQNAGRLRLEKYFVAGQLATIDPEIIYGAIALTALLLGFYGMGGILQGFGMIRRGKMMSQQARLNVSGAIASSPRNDAGRSA